MDGGGDKEMKVQKQTVKSFLEKAIDLSKIRLDGSINVKNEIVNDENVMAYYRNSKMIYDCLTWLYKNLDTLRMGNINYKTIETLFNEGDFND